MADTRDELRELISAPLIKDRYAPDHVRHYADLQLDALSAAGYAVVPLEATEEMVDAITVRSDEIDEEMRNYVSGISTDWDTGMVAQEQYRAAIAEGNLLTKEK